MNIDDIKEYYEKTGYMYRWFYSDKKSLGIHYGFWHKNTKSSEEALTNVYKEVLTHIRPEKDEVILDAGCGVGGASIWLAERSDSLYKGITISPTQVKNAELYAKNRKVESKVSFSLMDFHLTTFPDATFDAVFMIESSCYAHIDKLLEEAYRILKPRGKLMIIDYAPPRMPSGPYEKKMVDYFCRGYKMSEWRTKNVVLAGLSASHFKKISFTDKTAAIKKSVDHIYRTTLLTALPFCILRLFRLISKVEFENGYATYAQKKLYTLGLFQYGIYRAEK